jgi:cytochrome c-type biogenesis protein CcmH
MDSRGRTGRRVGHRPSRSSQVVLLLALLLLTPVLVRGAPSRDLEDRVRDVSSGLRCVVCQNLSVADSPSELAKEMRDLVREQLVQGKTPDQVRAYFVSRYGEFVLLDPPKRGFNLLLWGLPFLAVVIGAGAVYLVARRWTRGRQAEPAVDPAYAERIRQELQERIGSPRS